MVINMSWCPNCKNEYVEGISVCADCGAELVASLEDATAAEDGDRESVENTSEKPLWHSAYQDSAQKAEDNKSSAYTLLMIGALGLFAVILILAGVIPLYQNSVMTRYFVCGVMGTLFFIFLIFGIVSMKNFKTFSKQAESENALLASMEKWCAKNLNAAQIDREISGMEDMAEEQKYFYRAEKMKQMIQAEYENLEEAFLDHFIDEYYQNLF